ncbi:MAG: hypothetical protein SH808_02100 [Saprospiraceae bacterium]|nr:hypothetical protein [Saprospiraceae bacterium]
MVFWKRGYIQGMNLPQISEIPQWAKAAFQLTTWLVLLYYYLKYRKKKTEVDPERIEYDTATGMGAFAVLLISMVVLVVVYGSDHEGWRKGMNNMMWILGILYIIATLLIAYKFRKKKQGLAAQSEIKNQDSN